MAEWSKALELGNTSIQSFGAWVQIPLLSVILYHLPFKYRFRCWIPLATMHTLSRGARLIQLGIIFYVGIAVLYTTNYLLISPIHNCVSALVEWRVPQAPFWPSFAWFSRSSASQPNKSRPQSASNPGSHPESFPTRLSNGVIHWSSSDFALAHGSGHLEPVEMAEDLFLSKAFANSMRPSKIIPYYYRATGNFDREDITITTLITSNRFQVFSRLVERYQGR